MKVNKQISEEYSHEFFINDSGLVAVYISARCKSKEQNGNVDEDLRVQIDGLNFREIPAQKNTQFFNIPPAFNGTCSKGNRKTVVFLSLLDKGMHCLKLIPKTSAFVEEVKINELARKQEVELSIEEKAEDCNNFSWYTFILVNLPLRSLLAECAIEKRFRDSDDVKIIIDGIIEKGKNFGKFKFWYLVGGILKWLIRYKDGEKKTMNINLEPCLDSGIHYLEVWADRMPTFNKIKLELVFTENKADVRAAGLIRTYSLTIKDVAKEFNIDPVIIGSVIYQEQSTNVNFIDTLTDEIGGLLYANTSIGIGQVRVQTAKLLEDIYPALNPLDKKSDSWADYNSVRVERLKDPWTNIRYVAAKIKFDIDRWNNAGFSIANKPDILGTLYNIEDVDKPIKPNVDPQPNDFGCGVEENYNKVKELLGL